MGVLAERGLPWLLMTAEIRRDIISLDGALSVSRNQRALARDSIKPGA